MFSREDANPDNFIDSADIPAWTRPILSQSIVFLAEQRADAAFEKLVEQISEAGDSE